MPQETIDGAEPTRKVIVAAGRTIQVGNGYRIEYHRHVVNGEMRVVGEQVSVAGKFVFSEGEEIDLPASEAARQIELGYAIEPGMPQTRPLGINGDALGSVPGKLDLIQANPSKVGLVSKQLY